MMQIPISSRRGVIAQATIDDADHALVSEFSWSFNSDHYPRTAYGRAPQRWVTMHRLIVPCPPGMSVDHINGDKLDNRRANLRVCAIGENICNRGKQSNNRSGYKGVYRRGRGWCAQIRKDKRKYCLGEYPTPEMAHAAYSRACLELHGEYAHPH